jgi:DNA-binding transcriptional LysR family regulator
MPGAPWTATTEPIAAGLLPVIIGRLSRRYPRLAIYVSQSPIAMLRQSVPQYADLREVDLVFGPLVRRAADDDLETELLFKEDLHVAAHIRHPCQRRRKVTLADLVHEPWCLPALDSLVGQRCIEAFRSSGLM